MSKNLRISGYVLMNTASLDDSGSVSIEAEDYGYPNYISSSFSASVEFQDTRTPILITEVIEYFQLLIPLWRTNILAH